MIRVDCEQGSGEWIECRLGIPTASEFGRIVTATGKLSAQRGPYMGELLAEWALGEPYADFENEWTERGKLLEPEALEYYAFVRDVTPAKVGFVYRDSARLVRVQPGRHVHGRTH